MDFLKAEIARKKRQAAETLDSQPDNNKKYFKRGDLIRKQKEEYFKNHGFKEKEIAEEIESLKERNALQVAEKVQSTDELANLPRTEVVRRFRDRLQPILFFGESQEESLARLRNLEVQEPENVKGIRNDYKDAMDSVDKAYLDEVIKSNKEEKSKLELQLWESKYTMEEIVEMSEKLTRSDLDTACIMAQEFIKLMMTHWGSELNSRSEKEKMTVKGKMETGTFTQTKSYLKPLLRMLKKQTVTDDIRDSLTNMIKYCLQRNYIKCHEVYMEMAIGNAPWPIGVTNAGIHARPARENIFSKHVAHVLNDETQRKFIQGLKRLLTKAQQYFPTDPSKSIDYVKPEKPPPT